MKSNDFDGMEASERLPFIARASKTQFALFGELDRNSTIYIKSEDTPLELLGSRPLEAFEISPGGTIHHAYTLLAEIMEAPLQWVVSLPLQANKESPGVARLTLVWQGFATHEEKLEIKKLLDKNAPDISAAVLGGSLWRGILAIAPVIARCRTAHKKNKIIQMVSWLILSISTAAGLLVLRHFLA